MDDQLLFYLPTIKLGARSGSRLHGNAFMEESGIFKQVEERTGWRYSDCSSGGSFRTAPSLRPMDTKGSKKTRTLASPKTPPSEGSEDPLVGRMVEIHLLNDKRFLGKVRSRDRDGMTVYCIPVSLIDTLPAGANIQGELQEVLHTLFFPYANIEYVDIGGEPVGFDNLFAQAFGGESLEELFSYRE